MGEKLNKTILIAIMMIPILLISGKHIMASTIQFKETNLHSLPVLTYHTFDNNPTFPTINTTKETFKAQLQWLKDNGYSTVTGKEMSDYQLGKIKRPNKSFMITIDDGYKSVYDVAYPVLKELNMTATLFVITSHIETGKRLGMPMASWSQLREMQASGVFEIENHTHDLHWRLNEQSGKEAMVTNVKKDGTKITDTQRKQIIIKDLLKAKELIRVKIGITSTAFSYPYGAFDAVAEEAVKEAGYTINHSTIEGLNYPSLRTTVIRRLNMNSQVKGTDLLNKVYSLQKNLIKVE